MKKIEVNLGIGMNMLFPETINIIIDDTFEKKYKKYLKFVKKLEEPDFSYLIDDPNKNKLRKFTFEEFIDEWNNSQKLQKEFK